MIQLNNIALARGEKQLFSDASATINPGQKVALIGANGAGKSSLFKLLLGELAVDQGDLFIPKKWVISHMAQEHPPTTRTALDFIIDGDSELRSIERDLEVANANNDGAKIAACHAKIEAVDGYMASHRALGLMLGLGFLQSDAGRPVSDFSGGWRMRLNLAHALMCRSDLLLLDEPTNHLDIDTVIWLQDWLKNYEGTLILISHDRDFIDNTSNIILSVEHQQLISYTGNYSAYERQKAERLAQQQALYEKQQVRKKEIEGFVARFRYKATKAKQAQSRLKELQRMEELAPAHVDSPFSFRIDAWEKASSPLMNVDQLTVGYGDKAILSQVDFSLMPGQRIGLLGANGAGKSTLIKTLTGDIAPLNGEIVKGEHFRVGYFAQQQLEALDLEASAVEHIMRLSPDATEQQVRSFLGGFNFQGDRAFEVIKPFSGGEKTRLALALVVWQKPNILILDEPTNHLDLEVRHALTVALQGFEGAVLLVSHDRHLLMNTVDQYWLVGDGKVTEFDGDLDAYAALQREKAKQEAAAAKPKTDSTPVVDKKAQRQAAAAKRAEQAPLRKRLKAVEKSVEQLSEKIESLESQLADPAIYTEAPAKAAELAKEQGVLSAELEAFEEEWMELSELLE